MSNTSSAFNYGSCPVTYGFTRKGMITPILCGQWACPKCRKRLARDWSNRAWKQVTHAETPYFFWTLTMHARITDKAFAYKILPKLWDTLRKHIQRYVKESGNSQERWMYLAFVEGQPKRNHMPHFHILSSVEFPGRIKDFAARHGWGYQALQKPVSGQQAADYVSKYVSKGDSEMPKGFRRCRPSVGWAKLKPPPARGLLVPERGERDWEFWVRVSDETGKPIEVVRDSWTRALRGNLTDED